MNSIPTYKEALKTAKQLLELVYFGKPPKGHGIIHAVRLVKFMDEHNKPIPKDFSRQSADLLLAFYGGDDGNAKD